MKGQRLKLGARADGRAHAHDLHRAMDRPLVDLLQRRGDLRHSLRDLEHARLEVGGRIGAIGQPDARGLGAGHRIAGEHQLHGVAHAGEPGMELGVGRAHEAHRRIADLRVLRHVDEVAGGGQLAAAGQAIPVHLGDHRLGEVPDLEPPVHHVARPVPVAPRGGIGPPLGEIGAEIIARGEADAGAPHDGHAHRLVPVGAAERVEELAAKLVAERIALLGAVERHPAHARSRGVDHDEAVRGAGHRGQAGSAGSAARKSPSTRLNASGWSRLAE